LTILGWTALFRVEYTEAGVPDGAVRYTDAALVTAWAAYLQGLYSTAEDLAPYFARVVAPPRSLADAAE